MDTNILTALGAGSGIDVKSLVSQLVAVEKAPRQQLLDARTTSADARISALSSFRSSLDALISALGTRISSGALSGIPAVSDMSAIGLKVEPGALVDRQTVEISQLARAQSLSSAPVADASAPVGQGTLTIRFGAVAGADVPTGFTPGTIADLVVTIGPGDDSLTGLKNAINDAAAISGAPVQAQIITDVSGSRLVLRGQSGEESGFIVETSGDAALAQYGFDPNVAGGLTRNQTALDAIVSLDGVSVRRPSNTIDDLIEGATLSLYKAQPGTSLIIEAQHDPAEITDTVTSLVAALNQVVGVGKELTAGATSTASAGALASDSATRRAMASLGQLGSQPLLAADGTAPTRLIDIGVSITRDGTFTVDSAALSKALAKDPGRVAALVSEVGRPPKNGNTGGMLSQISSTFAVVVDGANGNKSALQTEKDDIARAQAKLDAYIAAYQTRMTTQFTALDQAVGKYKSIQAFMQQQIDLWTNKDSNN